MENIGETFTGRIVDKATTYLDVNGNLETLEKNLRVLTSKAYDIKIRVENAEISGKKRKTREVGNWLDEVKETEKNSVKIIDELKDVSFARRVTYGGGVKKLKDEVCKLIHRSETFGELVIDVIQTSTQRVVETNLLGETFEQNLDNIMQCLSDQSPIIGIWGMGGVGKTTLAGHICTRLQSKPDKFHIYWVTISQNVNINKLQNDLAKKLNLDGFPKDGDTEEKAAFLHEDLAKRKNVVLILDDVWKYLELRHIGILLGLDGCNVIIDHLMCVTKWAVNQISKYNLFQIKKLGAYF